MTELAAIEWSTLLKLAFCIALGMGALYAFAWVATNPPRGGEGDGE